MRASESVTRGSTDRTASGRGFEFARISHLYGRFDTALQLVENAFHMLPAPPRSGIENRAGLRNVVQNLVQLRAERTPNLPLLSSLLH